MTAEMMKKMKATKVKKSRMMTRQQMQTRKMRLGPLLAATLSRTMTRQKIWMVMMTMTMTMRWSPVVLAHIPSPECQKFGSRNCYCCCSRVLGPGWRAQT